MRITYIQEGIGSTVYWSDSTVQRSTIPCINKNCIREPERIEIDIVSPCWQMCFCHEIAHVLLGYPENYTTNHVAKYQNECDAWRLAKSFCKSKYWNEKEALHCLETYRPWNDSVKITEIIATNNFE